MVTMHEVFENFHGVKVKMGDGVHKWYGVIDRVEKRDNIITAYIMNDKNDTYPYNVNDFSAIYVMVDEDGNMEKDPSIDYRIEIKRNAQREIDRMMTYTLCEHKTFTLCGDKTFSHENPYFPADDNNPKTLYRHIMERSIGK